MGYASFSNFAHFKGDPEGIWDAFTNPAVTGKYVKHTTEFVPGPDFALEAGKSWEERHGAECDFDVVTWTIADHVPESRMDVQGKQGGILQRVRMRMEPVNDGYLLTESIRFSPAGAGKIGTSVVAWIMWATGLLPKFSNDNGESFELLRDYLDGKRGGDADSATAQLAKTMTGHAADFVAAAAGSFVSMGELDGSPESLAAVDRLLGEYGERTTPLSQDDYLRAAAYVFEVARADFGGRYVEDDGGDAFVLVVGEPACSVTVMAMGKVMKRVQHGSADSIEFFYAGIAPLVERGQSAVLR
ncbi:hypothetical protein ART_1220 [Arthrobacter sp. PAMC 25486]|nr:hypothetical protein ART_1220 [Arthrobacter sp. PAMC 25486]